MDLAEFRHQSDSRYCFSLDEGHVLLRLAVSKACGVSKVTVFYGDQMRFGIEHFQKELELRYVDLGFRYYETVVDFFPMRLAYVFRVEGEGGSFFYSESGLTEGYEFSLAFISAFQYNGENRADFVLPKPSWAGRVVYQIFPERFASRLDPKKKGYVNTPWETKSLKGRRRAFLGGDLYGVIDRLDYLADLGVGALYLTPIHPSPSDHKYDVLDYFDVDPAFGGKEALRELIEKAHAKGMKFIMDLVFNHTSCFHPFFLDVAKRGYESPYHDWYFIDDARPRKSPLNYRCFSTYVGMPKLDTSNPEVQAYLIGVGEYWMKEFGVDGYRLDVSEGVSHDFWMRFKMALKKIDPEVLLLGENWLNSESYLGPNQLDGVMNYPLLGVVSGYVLKIRDAEYTAQALTGLLMRYKDGHNASMLNLLSSHDVQRVRNLCKGDADLSLLAHAILMFFPGLPMVYYGEEIFMEGGGDPDNRRGMEWGSKEFLSSRHELFKKLMRLHRQKALQVGQTRIHSSQGALVLTRYDTEEGYALTLNLTDQGVPYEGELCFGTRVAGGEVWSKGFAVSRFKK